MPTAIDPIKVDNLKNMLASLKTLEVEVPTRVLRVALNSAANIVTLEAQRRAPARSGRLRSSIRSSSSASSAKVSGGSARVPYFGFIDYGGTVGRYRSGRIHQSARAARTARHFAVRPWIKTGRILYSAFDSQRLAVTTQMDLALTEALQHVGLEVAA